MSTLRFAKSIFVSILLVLFFVSSQGFAFTWTETDIAIGSPGIWSIIEIDDPVWEGGNGYAMLRYEFLIPEDVWDNDGDGVADANDLLCKPFLLELQYPSAVLSKQGLTPQNIAGGELLISGLNDGEPKSDGLNVIYILDNGESISERAWESVTYFIYLIYVLEYLANDQLLPDSSDAWFHFQGHNSDLLTEDMFKYIYEHVRGEVYLLPEKSWDEILNEIISQKYALAPAVFILGDRIESDRAYWHYVYEDYDASSPNDLRFFIADHWNGAEYNFIPLTDSRNQFTNDGMITLAIYQDSVECMVFDSIVLTLAFDQPLDNIDKDNDGFADRADCDDTNPDVNPGADDVCNGIDDNCNGQVDEESDADGDSICGDDDNCPDISNPDQTDSDEDGMGDACDLDDDNDGILDDADNCPKDSNADQLNNDQDAMGDACDPDDDNDGVSDVDDVCPLEDATGKDANGDGCIDVIENFPEVIGSVEMPNGIENALLSTVKNAEKLINKGNSRAAANQLGAFVNKIEAQRGKKIIEEDADMLIQYAEHLIASM